MTRSTLRNPHLQEISDMATTLAADFDFCQLHLQDENQSDFWRRSLARCACALVEAVGSVMRKFALEAIYKGGVRDVYLIAALKEETYRVDTDGNLKVQRMPLPTFNALSLAFRAYAAVFDSSFKLDKSNEGWASLRVAFEIRNRVMHPKKSGYAPKDVIRFSSVGRRGAGDSECLCIFFEFPHLRIRAFFPFVRC